MEFRTKVDIPPSPWHILPNHRLLFVGSCFADSIGRYFVDNQFRATVNPYGVMYNPASILHTVERCASADVAVLTLGTNHVYILKETGEIVDNCQKRPQHLFEERELSVEECADYLRRCIGILQNLNPDVKVILTVSPIRYAKYGFHGSQLSKATLLLAIHQLLNESISPSTLLPPLTSDLSPLTSLYYFPAYEILNDELRDYRFYADDMLHPSQQAVAYIYDRFAETFFAPETHRFIAEYRPIRQALNHRPFHPDSEEYRQFQTRTQQQLAAFREKYHL